MTAVDLIYCPWDSGRKDWRCGVGPTRILEQNAVARLAAGGVEARVVEIEPRALYESENSMGFEIQRRIADATAAACADGRLPLVLAGNCNAAVGGISGIGGGARRGHVWFDAHGDFCTPETTDSGFLDGMGLAMMVGRCWQRALSHMTGYQPVDESATALVGARDLDPAEAEDLAASAITHLRVEDIRQNGVEAAFGPFLERLQGQIEQVYIHVDLDVHDPESVPANQLNVPDGLFAGEVRDAIALIGRRVRIAGAGLGSYDPSVDPDGKTAEAAVLLLQALVDASRSAR